MQSARYKIFQDPPDDLNENWRSGALLGGITQGAYDWLAIADAFKLAGDSLIQNVPSNFEGYELVHPVLYCYRHAIELYLKTIVRPTKNTHNLAELLQKLIGYTRKHYQIAPPKILTELILEFDEYDKRSDAFRYPDPGITSTKTGHIGEWWIDFEVLKESMDYLQRCFRKLANDLH